MQIVDQQETNNFAYLLVSFCGTMFQNGVGRFSFRGTKNKERPILIIFFYPFFVQIRQGLPLNLSNFLSPS